MLFPKNYQVEPPLQHEGGGRLAGLTDAYVAKYEIAPDTSGSSTILTQTGTAGSSVVSTGITQPDVPRILSVTSTNGSATGNVVIAGKNVADQTISNTIALSGSSTVDGTKAFKTVTSITLPDTTSGSVAVGTSKKLGLPHVLDSGSAMVLFKIFNELADSGTLTTGSAVEINHFAPAGTPDGTKKLKFVYIVEP